MSVVAGTLSGSSANFHLDTLAAENFVSVNFARQIGLALQKHQQQIILADGTESKIHGIGTYKIQLNNFVAPITFLAADLDTGIDVILGQPFCQKHKAVIDYERRVCLLRKGIRKCTVRFVSSQQNSDTELQISEPHKKLLSCMQVKRCMRQDLRCFLVDVSTSVASSYLGPDTDTDSENSAHNVPPGVQSLLDAYSDVFPDALPRGLPPARNIQHTIQLESNATPPFKGIYRMSQVELQTLQKQLKELIDHGFIVPSTSPFGAPVLFVQKKDGSSRMCVDYRALNSLTVKNRYPLPRIDDLFDRLGGSQYFTSLDLMSGYHQIRITDEDVTKTAFRTPLVSYMFRVLPFGLTNAPSTFMKVMDDTFKDMRDFVVVYLDDILIFSRTEAEQVQHIEKVLARLRTEKLYAKISKCSFCQDRLLFLGHVVTRDGIRVDPQKVAAVQNWSVPTSAHQIRSFLGLANYFRKFMQGYSKMIQPLTALLRKDCPFVWTPECQAAFEQVQYNLTHAPCLALPDLSLQAPPFEVICDASGFAVGAVLLQNGRPIAFESRKMAPAERNYPVGEQELLAVFHAFTTWRCYLQNHQEFVVITDHNPNVYLPTKQNLSGRQSRRSEFFQRFQFRWVYRPGRTNIADPLSREPAFMAAVRTRGRGALLETSGNADVGSTSELSVVRAEPEPS